MKQGNLQEFFKQGSTIKKRKLKLESEEDDLDLPKKTITINKQDIEKEIINKENDFKKENQVVKKDNKIQVEVKIKPTENLKETWDDSYNPIKDAPFYQDQEVPFSFIAKTLQKVEDTTGENSQLTKQNMMSNVFRSIILLNPTQLLPTYLFCILKLQNQYEIGDIGIGKEIIVKSISKSCGRSEAQLRKSLLELGDYGNVVQSSKTNQKSLKAFFIGSKKKTLTMRYVFDLLYSLLSIKGNKSQIDKQNVIIKLLTDANNDEAKFLIRFLEKNLKVGASEKTMQLSLSRAFFMFSHFNDKEIRKINMEDFKEKFEHFQSCINRAVCEFPNFDQIIQGLFKVQKDIDQLQEICKVTPGIPCKPMLAKPCKSIQEILKRFDNCQFTSEYKYDGERGQIHYVNNEVYIYSRNLENMTSGFPDIQELIKTSIANHKIQNFIIDVEIVAFDSITKQIQSFQTLTHRSKKDVDIKDVRIQVCLFLFDLIYFNGESLMQKSLKERRAMIAENFEPIEQKLQMATAMDYESIEEIEEFLQASIKSGCEGLMLKKLEEGSTYEPAKRSWKWLKLKKDYLNSGMADSVDVVPIGAYHGKGKRTGVYGTYLLAVYNPEFERFEMLTKIGTGFSDENLKKFYEQLQENIIQEPLKEYLINNFKCDVWFRPSCVWEVIGADLSISPVYTCGIGEVDENKGLSMRFPRLIRQREDKDVYDTSPPDYVVDLYKNQAILQLEDENNIDEDEY